VDLKRIILQFDYLLNETHGNSLILIALSCVTSEPIMISHKISVYTGPGASNSWIWLADFLESYGYWNTHFHFKIDGTQELSSDDILIISGGDTFQIAMSLGESGMKKLAKRIAEGMGYIGICAGAYLPLRSSIAPLSSFNLTNIRIANLSSKIPHGMIDIERYTVPYGCSLVFHPARGPVRLSGDRELTAPLYGGPLLMPSETEKVVLFFKSLVDETEILLDRNSCEKLLIGKAACVESQYGKGRLLLIAPHLEHPGFPAANDFFAHLIELFEKNNGTNTNLNADYCGQKASVRELRKVIADLRSLTNAMDSQSWKVGIKYWEGEKLQFFVEAVRRRINRLIRNHHEERLQLPLDCLLSFKRARNSMRTNPCNYQDADFIQNIVNHLSAGTSLFMNSYFEMLATIFHNNQ